MQEVEKILRCPHCREKISMILDLSVDGHHTYIEDCEVCCRPIQISFIVENGQITAFRGDAT